MIHFSRVLRVHGSERELATHTRADKRKVKRIAALSMAAMISC